MDDIAHVLGYGYVSAVMEVSVPLGKLQHVPQPIELGGPGNRSDFQSASLTGYGLNN